MSLPTGHAGCPPPFSPPPLSAGLCSPRPFPCRFGKREVQVGGKRVSHSRRKRRAGLRLEEEAERREEGRGGGEAGGRSFQLEQFQVRVACAGRLETRRGQRLLQGHAPGPHPRPMAGWLGSCGHCPCLCSQVDKAVGTSEGPSGFSLQGSLPPSLPITLPITLPRPRLSEEWRGPPTPPPNTHTVFQGTPSHHVWDPVNFWGLQGRPETLSVGASTLPAAETQDSVPHRRPHL